MNGNLWQHLSYWKLVYWKLGVKSVRVGLVTLYTASNSVHWASLSGYERFVIIAGASVAVLDVWDSFFDQTLGQLKAQMSDKSQEVKTEA